MKPSLRLGLPALAVAIFAACSSPGSTTTYNGPTPPAPTPSPSGALLRALWVLSPVGLSLRDNSTPTAQLVAHIPQGTQVTATEFRPGSPGWYHVSFNGTQGWIADRDVKSSPPQALVTARAQLAYSNPGAGYYFLYPATWTATEKGSDVEMDSPPPNGETPQAQPSGAAPILGVTPTRLIVHVAPDVNSLGTTPTTSGAILDTLDFEVGGVTAIKRTYSIGGGGYEGDTKVAFAPGHAVLVTLRGGAQSDLDIFTEILSSFGFSIQAGATPSPSR